jgi:hypothetical protein
LSLVVDFLFLIRRTCDERRFDMPQFLILLRDGGTRSSAPDERQQRMQRYGAWTESLRQAGHLVGANKLRDGEGRVVRRDSSEMVVTDGPFVETKEILGGYYLLTADSYEQAIELTRDCPHYDYGSVEVRQVEDLGRR